MLLLYTKNAVDKSLYSTKNAVLYTFFIFGVRLVIVTKGNGMNPANKDVVAKSNKLIQASYRLTLVEQQIILFAICKAREEKRLITESSRLYIRAKEFAAMFHTNETKVYHQLKQAAFELFKRQVIIETVNEKTGKIGKGPSRWVQHVKYWPGSGEVELAFTMEIIPFITRLEKNFTKYGLEKVAELTSVHAIRLYEMCVQRLNMKYPPAIEIEALKEAFDLKEEYERTDSFKRSVLDVAINQINKFTDLNVAYKQLKTGRVITHFDLEVRVKPEHKPEPQKKGMDAAYLAEHARPGERHDDAFHRVRAERAKRKSAKRPEQMPLPECLAEPIPRKPDDPAVKESMKATREAVAALKKRHADTVS
jgi:plasmid replication initiation protein